MRGPPAILSTRTPRAGETKRKDRQALTVERGGDAALQVLQAQHEHSAEWSKAVARIGSLIFDGQEGRERGLPCSPAFLLQMA